MWGADLTSAQTPARDADSVAPPQQCDRVMSEIVTGHYDRALTHLSGIPTAGRSEAEQANLRGLALMLSGRTSKAVEAFDTALDLQPSFGEARFNRAIARLRSGEYARALPDLEPLAADAKSPLQARAAYHQALALDALGRRAEAEAAVTRSIAADPQLDDARLYKGVIAERRGDYQAAGKAYKAYVEAHPDSLVAMLRFAVSAQRAGYPASGRKYLQRILELAPDSAEAAEARKYLEMWD